MTTSRWVRAAPRRSKAAEPLLPVTQRLPALPRWGSRLAGHPAASAWPLLGLPALLFLALPLAALLVRVHPAELWANLLKPQVGQAIRLSLVTSLWATGLGVVFGTPLAMLLARRQFRGRRALDVLVELPMVLPPAAAGVALLLTFGRRGLLGGPLQALGLEVAFTTTAVVLAQTFISAPLYLKSAMVGFGGVDRELEESAALDGASGWQLFRWVTVPLAWPALLTGMVLAWARALGEFGATLIFAGNFPGRTQTMPLAIYLGFELNLDVALTLSILLVAASFVVLMVVKGLLQREG
jgi:molybdate transport system permease protein